MADTAVIASGLGVVSYSGGAYLSKLFAGLTSSFLPFVLDGGLGPHVSSQIDRSLRTLHPF